MNLLSLLCSHLPGYKWREVEELHEAETEVDGKSSSATFPRLRANHCYCYPVDQSRIQVWRLHRRVEHRRFLTLVASLQHQIPPSYDVEQAQMQIEDEETVIIAAVSCPVGWPGQLHDTEPIPTPLLERLNRIKHAENIKKNEESKRGYLYANDLEKV